MKRKNAVRVLLVIIIADLVGLFGLIYHRSCLKKQNEAYNNLIEVCYEEDNDVQQIRQLIYLYEFQVEQLRFSNDEVSSQAFENQKNKIIQTELKLRKQLIKHGLLMQKISKEDERAHLFRQVNDYVLNYLNMNTVVITLIGTTPLEEINLYINNNINPLVKSVDKSVNTLSEMASNQIIEIRTKIDKDLNRSDFISFFSILLMVCSIIVSICYTHSIISVMEIDREVFKNTAEQKEQKINEIQEQIIIGMADLVEKRSGETGMHVKRTSHYVNLILKQAKKHELWPQVLDEAFISNVTRAAPLHDLGKIIIPDMILNKPGRLTPEEFEIMKTHASYGGTVIHQILDGIEDTKYLNTACDIATCHHEKWDGSGYPNGLKGNEIPLCARVMSVADVFDALVSERCYKKAMSYEDAFALIQKEAGKQFDPEIAGLFMELQDEITNEK